MQKVGSAVEEDSFVKMVGVSTGSGFGRGLVGFGRGLVGVWSGFGRGLVGWRMIYL